MEDIMILLFHNGKWIDGIRFEDYRSVGMFLPNSSNLSILRSCIYQTLNLDENKEELDIRYLSKPGSIPVCIEDELQLRFYLALKSRSSDPTDYPLCVSSITRQLDSFPDVDRCHSFDLNNMSAESDVEFEDAPDSFIRDIVVRTSQTIKKAATECRADDTDDENLISNYRIEKLEVGQIFLNKQVLMDAMVHLSCMLDFCYSTKRSCSEQYFVVCKHKECKWMVKASIKQNVGFFIIRQYEPEHTCPVYLRCGPKRHINKKVIGKAIKHKFYRIKRKYTPGDIMWDVRKKFGEEITYQKAWRAKENAFRLVLGTPKESYRWLPGFLHMMQKMNPGSYVQHKTDDQGRFEYMFFALEASIGGWKYCKPIVVVDATFLRSCYGGTLMSAVGQDALGMIYPLAFGVADGEIDASWLWFFNNFRAAYGVREGLVVVSDRHQSIEKASKYVYPDYPHCVCMVHLLQNLKTRFKCNNEDLSKYFRKACKAYSKEKFDANMMHLKNLNKKIPDYLKEVGYEKWSRFYFPMPGYNVLTTNIAESLNAVNKEAKHLPITALVEYLLDSMLDLFSENRNIALGTFTHLASDWERRLERRYFYASRMEVNSMIGGKAKVKIDGDINVVDMENKSCSCNGFQIDEVPCAHALAYIKKFGLCSYDYCSQYYTKKNMVAAYEGFVHPVPNKDTWIVPSDIIDRVVLPPVVKIRSGRPKKHRLKHPMEKHRKSDVRCSVCRGLHHNRRTCGSSKH